MAGPTVHPLTLGHYEELPEFYREADAAVADEAGTSGRPLLRYWSLILDQLGAVADLIDRLDPDVGAGSDLVDPYAADSAWLPWLAQLLGMPGLPPGLTESERRGAIAGAVSGWQAGTREALAAAAMTVINTSGGPVDEQYVTVRAHYGGDPFVIGVSVDAQYAPDLAVVVEAIEKAHARPAGVKLVVDNYAAPWQAQETTYDTWDGWERTWVVLEGTNG